MTRMSWIDFFRMLSIQVQNGEIWNLISFKYFLSKSKHTHTFTQLFDKIENFTPLPSPPILFPSFLF
jgi:hypothetical protein